MVAETVKTGWLSPTGEFIACEPYMHIKTALLIYQKIANLSSDELAHIFMPDKKLLDRGWISITILNIFDHGFCFSAKCPTIEQLKFLKPYYDGEYGLGMTESSKQDYKYFSGEEE